MKKGKTKTIAYKLNTIAQVLPLTQITMKKTSWPSSEGWVKMQQIVPTSQGNINIHYVYNQTLKIFDDFKFKS